MAQQLRRRLSLLAASALLGSSLAGTAVAPALADPGRVAGSADPASAPELPRGDSTDRIGRVGSARETVHYKITRSSPGEQVVLGVLGPAGTGEGYLRVETATATGLDCARMSVSPGYGRGSGALEPFGDCRNDTEVIVSISRGSTGAVDQDLLLRLQQVPVPVNPVPDSVAGVELNAKPPSDPSPLPPGESPWTAAALPARGGISGTLQPGKPAWYRADVGWGQQLDASLFQAKDAGPDAPRVAITVYDPALNTLGETRQRLSETGAGRTTEPVLVKNFPGDPSDPNPFLAGQFLIALTIDSEDGQPAAPVDFVLSTSVLGDVTGVPITAEQQAAARAKQTRRRVAVGLASAGVACLAASVVLFVRRR